MEDNKIKELFNQEKEYREKKNNQKCISIIKDIIEHIKNSEDNEKFDIISKLFMFEDQSNYTKMFIFNELLKNPLFINKDTKKQYYKLLIDSFTLFVVKIIPIYISIINCVNIITD